MKPDAAPRLVARHIIIRRGQRMIVNEANLTLNAGELTVLAGPNGAGKTTLARAMAGLIAFSGDVTFDATSLPSMSLRARARAISYLPQGHEFHWPMSVEHIVALGREPHADPFAQTSTDDKVAILNAMEATAVDHLASRSVISLSGGERARVALARALATEASVLIADEPIASLDARHQLIIMDLLRDIASRGAAVLAILHDLTLAMRFADRVVLMNEGRIMVNDTPALALTADRIAEIFGISVNRADTRDGPLLIPSRPI